MRLFLFLFVFFCQPVFAGIEFHDCENSVPWPQQLQCGEFSSKQFPETVKLPFMVLGQQYKKPPLLFISGGPGSAAGVGEAYIPYWLSYIDRTNLKRPLIIIDLPGTGNASPQFHCKELQKFNHWQLAAGLNKQELLSQSYQVLKSCRQRQLEAGDFSWMNVSNTASLLKQFVSEFPAQRLDVYAMSFGGRVAVELQRQMFGQLPKLGKVVLDSPYPVGRNLLEDWPEIFGNAIEMTAHSCKQNCQLDPGQVRSLLQQTLKKLEKAPLRKQLEVSGVAQSVSISSSVLLDTLFFALYDSKNRQRIVPALQELSLPASKQQNLNSLLSQYVAMILDQDFNLMTYYNLSCSGQKDVSPAAYKRLVNKQSTMWHEYLESEQNYNVCDIWPVDKEQKDFFTPLKNRRDTLILLGENDPVVLPSWFDSLLGKKNVDIRLFPGQGHITLGDSYCAQQWVLHFLDDSLELLDADCRGFAYTAKAPKI